MLGVFDLSSYISLSSFFFVLFWFISELLLLARHLNISIPYHSCAQCSPRDCVGADASLRLWAQGTKVMSHGGEAGWSWIPCCSSSSSHREHLCSHSSRELQSMLASHTRRCWIHACPEDVREQVLLSLDETGRRLRERSSGSEFALDQ